MARTRTSVSIDADLLVRARELSVDVNEAAAAGIRQAVDEAGQEDLKAWLEQHGDAFRRNAERDRREGLANERLRAF